MPLNAQFFAALRLGLYAQGLSQAAVDGMNAVCTAFDGFTGHDHCTDDLAAVLATCYLEAGAGFNLAIREIGRGAGKAYGVPAGPYNQVYYGRGPCQETWLTNYTRSEKRTSIGFVKDPDLMLDPKYGTVNMLDGMYNGLFTGKGLRNYITPGVPTSLAHFKAARAIINGQDKADKYADLCLQFQRALYTGYDKPVLPVAPISAPPAHQAPPSTLRPTPPPKGLLAEVAWWWRGKKG